MLEPNKFVD